MIVVLKHYKRGPMIYVSHIDLLRHFTRTFRRAGFEIDFSSGFNPHMLVNLGTPLPLGISSSSEYLTVSTNVPKEEFLERYNAVAPKGLEGIRVFAPASNPNIAGRTVAADYAVKQIGAEAKRREIERVVNLLSLEMPITKKGETTMKEVAPLINGIKVYPDSLNLCLAAGNTTLRPDKFALFLAEKFAFEAQVTDLWKYEQYVRGENGALLEVDAYLSSLDF
ncbi:MAG: DUF2344 domain-containing protein [Clostridia bacterium]|nr:DUF2344 domain-containing protein [Clostridia bacterium]